MGIVLFETVVELLEMQRSPWAIGLISFVTSVLGFFISLTIALIHGKTSVRQTGFFLGFTGGVLISIICFELLPEAIIYSGTVLPMIAMTTSLVLCAYLEHKVMHIKGKTDVNPLSIAKISVFAGIVIGLNDFPEGFALGSVLFHTGIQERHIIYALFLHCIIDGVIMFSNASYKQCRNIDSLKFIGTTSLVIAVAGVLGAVATDLIHKVMPISVGFVSGIMLYVALGEIIPKSRAIWNGRFSTLGACVGVVVGVIINSL